MNKLLTIFTLLYFIVLFNCSATTDSYPSQTHTIAKGIVSDTITGKPIDSVEIILKKSVHVNPLSGGIDYDTGPLYTNLNGEFYIENKHKYNNDIAIYQLSAGKQGYYYKFFDIEENEVNEFDIALKPWQTDYHTIVKGYFLEKDTNDPIEDVKVYLYQSINSFQDWNIVDNSSTNNAGYFYLENFYKRESSHKTFYYKFDFHKDGYDHPRYSINVNVDGIKEVILYLSPISG